jgi:hypothetical protein
MPRTERERARGGARGSPEVSKGTKRRPTSTPESPTAQAPDAFTLVLRPLPGTDGIRALRRVLKFALRSCGLRSVSCEEVQP